MPEILEKIEIPTTLSKEISDKYTVSNNTFILPTKDISATKIETEIGDIKQEEFYPQVKIKNWDNETNFSVRYIDTTLGVPTIVTENEIIKYQKETIEAHFYDKPEIAENGGFEFEVILKEKPISNIVEFSIETKGLDFYYQSELTQQEIDDGAIRPENIIGSYAVYHNSKSNNEYKTGKAFHIYRPKIVDSIGNWVWGELNIDVENKKLTITIPETFLNSGTYPIIVDPTFGYTTAGASDYPYASQSIVGSAFSAPGDGTIDSLTYYCSKLFGGTTNSKGVVVLNSNLNIVSNGVGDAVTTTFGWFTSSFSTAPSISNGTSYILSYICPSGSQLQYSYDSGDTNQGMVDETNNYTTPTNPTDATRNDNKYSVYATYTASGGGDLSISVNDTQSTTENITNNILDSDININDSISITEDNTEEVLETDFEISIYDSITIEDELVYYEDQITIDENINVEIIAPEVDLDISVNDNISISENIVISLDNLDISKDDSLTITENTTQTISESNISVIDTISITENISQSISESNIIVSDNLSITENISILISDSNIDIYDSQSISEDVNISFSLTIETSDSISIAENNIIQISDSDINVNDNISITEDIILLVETAGVFNIIVTDDLSITENIQSNSTLADINTNDNISISENAAENISDLDININDGISISEYVELCFTDYCINTYDSIVTSEDVALSIISAQINIDVNDSISITDIVDNCLENNISTSEDISISENISNYTSVDITISDSITITESKTLALAYYSVETSDSITISDEITIQAQDKFIYKSKTTPYTKKDGVYKKLTADDVD